MNKNTAREYHRRLSNFDKFVVSEYNISIDKLINDILQLKSDPYEILGDYCIYLQQMALNTSTLKNIVITAKIFLNSMILISVQENLN